MVVWIGHAFGGQPYLSVLPDSRRGSVARMLELGTWK